MKQQYLAVAAAFIAGFFLTACGDGNPGIGPYGSQSSPRISVMGEGEVSLAPDMATLTLTVLSEKESADKAVKANSAAMSKVLRAMQDKGVAEQDLRTSNFNIQPMYSGVDRDNPKAREKHIVGYSVRNTLSVIVRDMDEVGAILQTSIELGVNQGGNIHFGNANPQKALSQARKRAMEDARTRAKTLADAADVDLGDLLQVTEQFSRPQPRHRSVALMAADSAEAIPMAAGENSYRVTLNVDYGIDQ